MEIQYPIDPRSNSGIWIPEVCKWQVRAPQSFQRQFTVTSLLDVKQFWRRALEPTRSSLGMLSWTCWKRLWGFPVAADADCLLLIRIEHQKSERSRNAVGQRQPPRFFLVQLAVLSRHLLCELTACWRISQPGHDFRCLMLQNSQL